MRFLKFGAFVGVLSLALAPAFAGDGDGEYKEPTPEELLRRYDKNGNGKLSSSEKRAAVKGERIRRFDLNKDGKLDSTEKRKMKRELAKEAEFEKEVSRYFKLYDVIKKDGVIDGDELDRAEKVSKKGRGRWGGGRGGWGGIEWIEDADTNDDALVTRKELAAALKKRKARADAWRKGGMGRGRGGDKKDGDKKKEGDKKKDGDKKGGDDDTGNSP